MIGKNSLTKNQKLDLIVINRSFWPDYAVLGEGLLRFCEETSKHVNVGIITQTSKNLRELLNKKGRAKLVKVATIALSADSSASLASRVLDAARFGFGVFGRLLLERPKVVYISTDPPLVVPFFVMLYCKLFKKKYIYHIQDIHPEITNQVILMNPLIRKILVHLDSITIRNAARVITLNSNMEKTLVDNRAVKKDVNYIDNPSIEYYTNRSSVAVGFSFCGNIGRLQIIPILAESIEQYLKSGGLLTFEFAGGGVYSHLISELADKYEKVTYHGRVTPSEAGDITSRNLWAILPIDDEITRYAFPSKSSSYVCAEVNVFAICSNWTSVSQWVQANNVGISVEPIVEEIVKKFFEVESNPALREVFHSEEREELMSRLSFDAFTQNLNSIVRSVLSEDRG